MRQQDVFKKIGSILQELNDQYDYLQTQTDGIDDLELELFAANSHFLSDHLEILRKLNAHVIKSLPAHGTQQDEARQPVFQLAQPETTTAPVYETDEEQISHNSQPESTLEASTEIFEHTTEAEPEPETLPEPTLADYYHIETPAEAEPEHPQEITPLTEHPEEPEEAKPQPAASEFHFDFTTTAQQQEDAKEDTANQFQPEETEGHDTEPTVDQETEEVAEPGNEQQEPVAKTYHFEVPVTAPPLPTQPEEDHEEYVAETEIPEEHYAKPDMFFEPESTPAEIADGPVPEIDIRPDTGHDMFSFIRNTEPDTTRNELTFNEASGEGDEKGSINASYQNEDDKTEDAKPTVAEAMEAQLITPETAATPPEPAKPQPAPIPTYALNQPAPAPAVTEPERPLTLNERISAQLAGNANTGSAPTAPQPIKDLKSNITLNDKMLFVRDLFNGYSLAYSEAIEILNRFNNFEDAERFLKTNYVEKNHWADKPGTNEKFFDLLKRRFA